MSATFAVKNFERFQHYKDRSPPWIKLYNELLDDYEFGSLPDASKAHLIAIWLLASRSENRLPFDPIWVAKRINATEAVDLHGLAASGFIIVNQTLRNTEHVASNTQAECLTRERGREETEKITADASASARCIEVSKDEEGELFASAGKALSASANLFVMSEPIKWKEAGMNWLLDVLPTIRALSAKAKPGSIKTWGYYTQAIADAFARRTAPMPAGNAATGPPAAPRSAAKIAMDGIRKQREYDEPQHTGPTLELGTAGPH